MVFNLLKSLSNDELNLIKYINIKKNEILFEEDSICNNIGIVIIGRLSINSYSYNGKEIIYSLIDENELFGHNLLFSSSPLYKGNVIALKDSKIALISKDSLIYLLQNNKSFLYQYLEILNNNAKSLNSKLKLLSFDNAIDRLLYFLYQNNNEITVNSITELANRLFLRRESLSRCISRLKKENIINVTTINNLISIKKV